MILNELLISTFFLLTISTWTEVADLPARDLSYTVPNLTEGEETAFRILAVNDIGPSEPSRPTEIITVQDQPGVYID